MKKYRLFIPLVVCVAFFAMLIGCGKPAEPAKTSEQPQPQQEQKKEDTKKAEVDNSNFIPAADWKDKFPNQYKTYQANADESLDYPGAPTENDYTKAYPAIQTIYKGIGFYKYYDRPRGHVYALKDVVNTGRPKAGANCLSCKSPQYIIDEKQMGNKLYKEKFDEAVQRYHEPISCYDCHGNQPGAFNVQRTNLTSAMKDYGIKIDPRMQTCAQCHNEYYFDPETKAVKQGWKYGMDPDSILKFFNETNFVDFTQPDTGIGLIKVQHPDFETYQSSKHAKEGLVCADCHMEKMDGYTSHQWTSPFKSKTLVEKVCLNCHQHKGMKAEDLMKQVNDMQDANEARVKAISEELEKTTNDIAAMKDSMDKATFDKAAALYRDAQFYWDFVFVENGDSFHNPELAKETLDKAEAKLAECRKVLGK